MHLILVFILLALFVAIGGGPVLFIFFAWLFKDGFPWVPFLISTPVLLLFGYARYLDLSEPKAPK